MTPPDHGLDALRAAWDTLSQHWNDDVARDFEARYWAPLLEESRSWAVELQTLSDMLEAAEREWG